MERRFPSILYITLDESLQPHRLHVIGVSPGTSLAEDVRPVIESCAVVYAPARLQKYLGFFRGRVLGVSPLAQTIQDIRQELENADVAVVVGGDPMFFGIGRRLSEEFGPDRLHVHPALSSMQMAYSRLGKPWDDVHFQSLHGRPYTHLAGYVHSHDRVCLLAGGVNSVQSIAARLHKDGVSNYRAWVFEDLGEPGERITEGGLEDISRGRFSEMSLLVLERNGNAPAFVPLGLSEDEIIHSRGLITKDEVRAAVLHGLKLPSHGVFWDIGAGSGSISVEASRLCSNLDIHAVERNPAELQNIQGNLQCCGPSSLTVVRGEAPQACAGLPDPDRVFVGGSGGRLKDILYYCTERLKPGGRIVVSAVTESTRNMAPTILLERGLEVSASRITVHRSRWTARGEETTDLNPISLIKGIK